MDGGQRARRLDLHLRVEAVEQLRCLLEPSLPHAQVGQPHQRADAQPRALPKPPQPHGLGQGGVGLGPASRRGQHAAVVGAAEGRDGGELAPLGDRLPDPDPLLGPGNVLRVLTGREQLAEDLLQDQEVVDLAAGHRRERLVQQQHALLDAVTVHQARPQIGQRHQLQVGVPEPAGRRERLAEALLLAHAVALEHAEVERHPARLGRVGGAGQQRLRTGKPAARHGAVTDDREVHARQRARHPDRAQLVPDLAVRRIGALPALDGSGEVQLQVGGAGQALEHLAGRRAGQGTLQGAPCAHRITGPQCGAALVDQLLDRHGHAPIIARSFHLGCVLVRNVPETEAGHSGR